MDYKHEYSHKIPMELVDGSDAPTEADATSSKPSSDVDE